MLNDIQLFTSLWAFLRFADIHIDLLVFNSFLGHNLQALAAFPNMSHPARKEEMKKVHEKIAVMMRAMIRFHSVLQVLLKTVGRFCTHVFIIPLSVISLVILAILFCCLIL
jgi:hypothetical protein